MVTVVSSTGSTETGSSAATSDFTDDFDYPSDELSENGWTVDSPGIEPDDSYLTTASEQTYQWISRPIDGTGRYFIDGARNQANRDLRIVLTPSEPSGNVYDGYQIFLQGVGISNRDANTVPGEVFFARRDGQVDDILLHDGFQHGGDYHNYELRRESDGTMELRIDGELFGSISDDAISEIGYIGIRFDNTGQRLDKVQHQS